MQRTIRSPTLLEFCELAELEEESLALVRSGQGPREFIAALDEAERFADAVRLLAHALPRREAIWWAWSSARRAAGEQAPPAIRVALDATERWIREPVEDHRRAAMPAAEAADLASPAGCAALAVFLSGGSITPPGLQEVEPDPYAASKAIAGAVILAAVAKEPEKAPERFRESIARGLEVAERVRLWPAAGGTPD